MKKSTESDTFTDIPQAILDKLTNVEMPRVRGTDSVCGILTVEGMEIPVYRAEALVLGSGAAGMRAAVELKRRGVDVLVASTGLFAGTSACSGSDKQTLYSASTDFKGDNFVEFAKGLCSGGAMNFSTAYVEAVGSIDAVSGLQYIGLPLPHDENGAVLRYQTDHDEAGRATSCGPRTSRLMVKVLFEEAIRLAVRVLADCSGIRIVKMVTDSGERVAGVIALHRPEKSNPYGMIFIGCDDLVIAAGGPGELYRDSVYPHHCYGGLGLALEAGISVCNLTESQFGIGTPRSTFPWNLSGTYVQVMPRVYSVDDSGREINFLKRYYRTTREMVSNTFRKGYQWPFHSTRMLDYGSSLFDLAVYLEQRAGRIVYLDFLRNPDPAGDGKPFSLEDLDADVFAYLENNDALLALPIDRLHRMNPLAIELYRMHGSDLTKQPLQFGMNNQHMNGGIQIDDWGRTDLAGCYAIGEAGGSHGVTRPGGAALNSGQVFGKRVAIAIKRARQDNEPAPGDSMSAIAASLRRALDEAAAAVVNERGLDPREVRGEIQARMSDHAGIICTSGDVQLALDEARRLRQEVESTGLRARSPATISAVFRWKQMAWVSEAVLLALHTYIGNGGGSRGARAICSDEGTRCPQAVDMDLSGFRFREENPQDKKHRIVIRRVGDELTISTVDVDPEPRVTREFFEKGWGRYLVREG